MPPARVGPPNYVLAARIEDLAWRRCNSAPKPIEDRPAAAPWLYKILARRLDVQGLEAIYYMRMAAGCD
eukprot:COSAG01_NODE_1157_length_11476_cov_87.701503_3_plen_69_part_00